ncbi:LysM peptidoglycan-binding domain-containing protein [Alicyclobacillus sp.]|uniref:LysM peptidoglycan-binding domain-containing protein n=1 Tax=Alicyclobacillus sp. TaxID=61169 RepID=UPI0025BBACA4|nr:LysM peptidoglycan-binding domain-containing protein [Alicyclobacillus sp.]MCL6516548.1 LysM peptidoglycan-binding domain-containing protein [Alicyclobacillus sp.]
MGRTPEGRLDGRRNVGAGRRAFGGRRWRLGLMLAVLVGCGAWGLHARAAQAGAEPMWYTVRPGDTLWTVVAREMPGTPMDQGVWAVMQENHLTSARLVPGQRLALPQAARLPRE